MAAKEGEIASVPGWSGNRQWDKYADRLPTPSIWWKAPTTTCVPSLTKKAVATTSNRC